MPSEAEWSTYNANYFARAHGQSSDTSGARLFRAGMGKLRVSHVIVELERRRVEPHAVLEIGPGYGEFVAAFMAARPDVAYFAQETDSSVLDTLAKLGVQLVGSSDDPALAGQVDLVVISHVLEHTIDPVNFLRACTQCLRPGGVLFVEVPCRDDLYKSEDEPHLLFFDKPAMTELMTRARFSDLTLTYHGGSHIELWRENVQSPMLAALKKLVLKLRGFVPFGHLGLTPKEWSVVRPFKGHQRSDLPARWLRLVATKQAEP
jgi:SAM-dependent methyltransferase